MPMHDNEFLIKIYGACTNDYGSFTKENVTYVRMEKTC